jgi:hypothetical protein
VADYTWPFAPGGDFSPEGYDEAVEFNVELSVARSGRVTTQSLPGARWRTTMNFRTVPVSQLVQRRQLEAFFLKQRGGADRLLLWNLQTPEPLGTLRGAPTLSATMAAGASSLTLGGGLAGANLVRRAGAYQAWGTSGWSLSNATITGGQTDPDGQPTAGLITRTAGGVCYVFQTYTTTTHASKAASFTVRLKAGTLAGVVRLQIQDGSGTVYGTKDVTPSGAWQWFQIAALIGASPAANLRVVMEFPSAGSAGDTVVFWAPHLEVLAGSFVNCCSEVDTDDGPPGYEAPGMRMLSVAAGDTFFVAEAPRTVLAGEVFTGSVWLKAGTLGGTVALVIYDSTSTLIASLLVTPTGTWQRFSVTATMPASSSVQFMVNPTPAATAAGQTLSWFGVQIEPGAETTTHQAYLTLLRGDRISVAGQRVVVVEDALADPAGAMQVNFQPAHRLGAASTTPVVWQRPTTRYVLAQPVVQMSAQGGLLPGFAVELVEE